MERRLMMRGVAPAEIILRIIWMIWMGFLGGRGAERFPIKLIKSGFWVGYFVIWWFG
jgi:hypothetical protein